MANKLPDNVRKAIKERVFTLADKIGYSNQSRKDNGMFLNSLVNDPEVGGVLKEYIPLVGIRHYIKDAFLHDYARTQNRKKLDKISFEDVIYKTFEVRAQFVGSIKNAYIYRDDTNNVYLLHLGTYLKWETALRKLLECIIANPNLEQNAQKVYLCLVLTVSNGEMSFGDQEQVKKALQYIRVHVHFVR